MRTVPAFAAFAALAAVPAALAHEGDIGVRFSQAGALETYLVAEELRGSAAPVERVFASDLGTVEFGPFGNDEPGYFTDSLPEGLAISFNIRAQLRKWNGSGYDDAIPETLQLAQFLGTPGQIERRTAAGFVPGFAFATVSAGGFDEHLSHILSGPGNADPSAGIYLLELELHSSSALTSDPFWIVFNLSLDEAQHDAAIDYVVDNIVPAPGSAALVAAAALFAGRRRR